MTKATFGILVIYICGVCIETTQAQSKITPDASVANAWADLTIKLMTKTRFNTPTYGSRALGYIGLTMYETVVPYSPKNRSVAATLCDTLLMPKAPPKKLFCPEIALNAGQAYMLHNFYGFANKQKWIDALEDSIKKQYATQLKPAAVAASVAFGRAVATRIFEWSNSDGGIDGWDRNFPKDYVRPVGTGVWVPPLVGQSNSKIPMHPTWGNNRTFSTQNAKLPLPKPLVYSKNPTSEYYQQYREVYDRKRTLTDAEREIVVWWGDDPTLTCSPPGHSYHLATIAIRNANADLVKAAETYARLGMAVSDAFVVCWKTKFEFMVERPSSFVDSMFNVHRKFEGPWLPMFLEPPFPSFYSGHAVQSAATATVLTELFGDKVAFTDDTHADRETIKYREREAIPDDFDPKNYKNFQRKQSEHVVEFRPRTYKSFWEAAQECANSRLMGGIHTRHDNEVGLKEGVKIGRNINLIKWR